MHGPTDRGRDADGVPHGGGPPHHQVGEDGDPNDGPEEGDHEETATCRERPLGDSSRKRT